MIRYLNVLCIVFLLLISTIFTGCAAKRKIVRKDRYVSLNSICSDYDVSWAWDGFSKTIRLNKRYNEVWLYPGSSLIRVNNKVCDLVTPVEMKGSQILVPESLTQLVDLNKSRTTVKKIVIDAGHGGKDPGAMGSQMPEKDIVLDIVIRLKKELAKAGFNVLMTRDQDVFIPLQERAELANRKNADLFISVHVNASSSAVPRGFEAFYLAGQSDQNKNITDLNTGVEHMFASGQQKESIEIAHTVSRNLEQMLYLETRYIKGANFRVLKVAKMPAVLLELGYVTNNTEGKLLNNSEYRQMLSESIAKGIFQYANN